MFENGILLHLTQMLLKFQEDLHFIDIKMHLIPSVTQVEISGIISLSHFVQLKMTSIRKSTCWNVIRTTF